MKKFVSAMMILLTCIIFFTAGTEKENSEDLSNISYTDFTVTEKNRDMIGFKGTENEELVIPETFKGEDGVWYRLTEIDLFAFAFCSELTSITLPGSITRVGEFAFLNCPKPFRKISWTSLLPAKPELSTASAKSRRSAGSPDTICWIPISTEPHASLADATILLCVRLSARFPDLCSTPSAAARSRRI